MKYFLTVLFPGSPASSQSHAHKRHPNYLPQKVTRRDPVNGGPRNCANPYCQEPLVGEILSIGTRPFCNELCVAEAPEKVRQ